MITADLRLDNRDDMLARIGADAAGSDVLAGFADLLSAWEKFGDAVWPMLRGPFAAAIWNPQQRVLTLARDPARSQCRDVASKRALLRLRHHAQRAVCAGGGAARIERGEIRRFPRAQSRRSRDHHLQGCVSGSSGACAARRCRGRDHAASLLVAGRYQAGEVSFRSGLRGRVARMSRQWRCGGRCAAPIRSAACSAAASIRPRLRCWRRVRSRKTISG